MLANHNYPKGAVPPKQFANLQRHAQTKLSVPEAAEHRCLMAFHLLNVSLTELPIVMEKILIR